MENFELMYQEQAGFSRNRSTNEVSYFSQAIKDVLENSEVLIAAFLDVKSVYVSVWRELLTKNLSAFDVKSSIKTISKWLEFIN